MGACEPDSRSRWVQPVQSKPIPLGSFAAGLHRFERSPLLLRPPARRETRVRRCVGSAPLRRAIRPVGRRKRKTESSAGGVATTSAPDPGAACADSARPGEYLSRATINELVDVGRAPPRQGVLMEDRAATAQLAFQRSITFASSGVGRILPMWRFLIDGSSAVAGDRLHQPPWPGGARPTSTIHDRGA